MKTIQGDFDAKGLKVHLIVSRFNELISKKLLEGCLDGLKRHGAVEKDLTVYWVPGSLEMPLLAKKIASAKKPDAVICLGAVIRGGTGHYDIVAGESAKGIAQSSLETGVPIVFGVLTTESIEQAIERAGTKMGNKGFDAAMTAIEMANLLKAVG
ncbi:6,7-dimethyl-8-ribityllumazine synthase [Candidatus Sumerlaeota bacterium]